MAAAVAVAPIGIYLAWSWYHRGGGRAPARLAEAEWPGVYRTVSNKYYVDEAYEAVFVQGLALGGGRLLWEVDATVVDLIPERRGRRHHAAPPGSRRRSTSTSWTASSTASATRPAGSLRLFRRAQTGRVQNYALVMGGGFFGLVAVYLFFR